MDENIGFFVNIGIVVILLGLGLFVGRARERSHLLSLKRREEQLSGMLVTDLKSFPASVPGQPPPCLLMGETVIATDYFKSFLAKLRNIFGGEVRSYQTLLVRARRESLLRKPGGEGTGASAHRSHSAGSAPRDRGSWAPSP